MVSNEHVLEQKPDAPACLNNLRMGKPFLGDFFSSNYFTGSDESCDPYGLKTSFEYSLGLSTAALTLAKLTDSRRGMMQR